MECVWDKIKEYSTLPLGFGNKYGIETWLIRDSGLKPYVRIEEIDR